MFNDRTLDHVQLKERLRFRESTAIRVQELHVLTPLERGSPKKFCALYGVFLN